ncbi:DUF6053 domain-containing protein [Lysobacter yananisis]
MSRSRLAPLLQGRGRNVAIRAKSVGPEGPPTNAR